MTKFNKAEFNTSGEYLTYGQDRKFVARFKHRGPFTKARLIKALCNLYTTEEYFARVKEEAPFKILMNDGHVDFGMTTRKFTFNF